MSALDNLTSNLGKVSYDTVLPIDRVIWAQTISFTVTNSVAAKGDVYTVDTGLGQYALPIGIYTNDGGATFLEYRGLLTVGSSLAKNPDIPAVTVAPHVTSAGILKFNVHVNATVGGDSTIPITVYTALLAIDTPSPISSPPGGSNVLLSSNLPSAPNRKSRKIATTQDQTAADSTLHTYPHGLGIVPTVAFWDLGTSGDYSLLGYDQIYQNTNVTVVSVKMDATNVYVGFNASYSNIYFRAYYES